MRKKIDHWCLVVPEKSKPSGPPFSGKLGKPCFPLERWALGLGFFCPHWTPMVDSIYLAYPYHLKEKITSEFDIELISPVEIMWDLLKYLHFQSKPLMNLLIFATVHSLMNEINLIDSWQAYLPVQYASNIEFIRQKWHWCCDWQRTTPESHVQNKLLVCSIGCPCSHWLVCFSVLHSKKNVNTITH